MMNGLYSVKYVEVGPQGERIDKKEYVTNWEQAIKQQFKDDPLVAKIKNQSTAPEEEKEKHSFTPEEEEKLAESLNKPEMYFNEDNLRKAYQQPGGNLIDFIKYALRISKPEIKRRQ